MLNQKITDFENDYNVKSLQEDLQKIDNPNQYYQDVLQAIDGDLKALLQEYRSRHSQRRRIVGLVLVCVLRHS
jgi:hypothetical protein